MSTGPAPPLRRTGDAPRVRMAHLGLGAFHRSHQAWWTGAVGRTDPWGIAAFTGRGPAAAAALRAQGGLYTLLVRGGDADRAELVAAISDAADGADATGGTMTLTAAVSEPSTLTLLLTGMFIVGLATAFGRSGVAHLFIARHLWLRRLCFLLPKDSHAIGMG